MALVFAGRLSRCLQLLYKENPLCWRILLSLFFLSLAVIIARAMTNFEHSSNCGRGWMVPIIGCSVGCGTHWYVGRISHSGNSNPFAVVLFCLPSPQRPLC